MPFSGVIIPVIPYSLTDWQIDRTGDQLNVIPLQGSVIYVYKGKLNKLLYFVLVLLMYVSSAQNQRLVYWLFYIGAVYRRSDVYTDVNSKTMFPWNKTTTTLSYQAS